MTDSTRTRPYGVENTPVSSEPVLALEPASYVGRYRIERLLGKGSFGVVYLARDEQLDRPVAIKLTYRTLIPRAEDAESHLAEARTVAQLDHPNIVPIYDVGSNEACPCYIVTKYIEGQTLADKIKASPPSLFESVQLVIALAEALHFAHGKLLSEDGRLVQAEGELREAKRLRASLPGTAPEW